MILAIDTTTQQAGVALADGAGESFVVRSTRRRRVTTHSEALVAMVDEALGEAGVTLAAVDAIACAAGPGSFTGLRIGLATAKGLCLALGRPLLMISSLRALALRVPAGAVAVGCIDAWKGEVYAGYFRGGPEPAPFGEGLPEEEVLRPERLAERIAMLRAGAGAPVHLVGDGPVRWPLVRAAGGEGAALAPLVAEDVEPPDPVDVARLAAMRHVRGEADDLAGASPRYLRPSEAELMSGITVDLR